VVVEGDCPECGIAVRRRLESVARGGFTVAAMRAARRAQGVLIGGLLALPLSGALGFMAETAVFWGAVCALVVVGIGGYQLGGIGSIAEPVPRAWRRWVMVGTAAGAGVAAAVGIVVVEEWPLVIGFGLLLANTWAVLVHVAWMRDQTNWPAKASNIRMLAAAMVLASVAYGAIGILALLAAVLTLAESYRDMGRLIRRRVGSVEGGGAG
jgi:hypothetical protein